LFEQVSDDAKRGLLREIGFELEARGRTALVHAGKPAAVMMNRREYPGWWAILDIVRNLFQFHNQIEGLIDIKRRRAGPRYER
jgi:hypothetical protein